jgi:hypothetical protein
MNAIWLASYPKSGNTWTVLIILKAAATFSFKQNQLDLHKIRQENLDVPICNAFVQERYCGDACSVLKLHSIYRENEVFYPFIPGCHFNTAGFIHIYRNPLDVLLSYINFSRIQYRNISNQNVKGNIAAYQKKLFCNLLGFKEPFSAADWVKKTLDDIPQRNLDFALNTFSENSLMIETLKNAGSWISHTRSWLDQSSLGRGISIRYEDCLKDSHEFLKILPYFKFDETTLLTAIESVNRKARPKNSSSLENNSNRTIFFNKMSAYYYKEYFTEKAISRFLKKYESVLKELGYSDL